jgi:hypothetical protein
MNTLEVVLHVDQVVHDLVVIKLHDLFAHADRISTHLGCGAAREHDYGEEQFRTNGLFS